MPLPIGTQHAGPLDAGNYDENIDDESATAELFDDDDSDGKSVNERALRTVGEFKIRAAEVYEQYTTQMMSRFRWLRTDLFVPSLGKDLGSDATSLFNVLKRCGDWDSKADAKLNALSALLTQQHSNDEVLVFTQFADTGRYLETQLRARGLRRIAGVTGDSDDPTGYAWRFSPESNQKREKIPPEGELCVSSIVVNFDLPWTIIRLIQRAGRVDRIGQKAEKILCYSFLPADGIENIIRLRARVRRRLRENAEVVGTDEAFFEDDNERQKLPDLYHEKAGILDGDAETEVDLASYAYQIWKNAVDRSPARSRTMPLNLPAHVHCFARLTFTHFSSRSLVGIATTERSMCRCKGLW